MTFLQPALLYGLPFILVPVLVHLLNKRRHRTYHWAAMMFLVRATQQARGRRKLRHFLILACRVLAVAALLFALSRPLAGGWVSWFGGNRPEAILVLLDRSASMESAPDESSPSKRAAALTRITSAVKEFASGTRIVLFESTGGPPLELSSADALAALPQSGPSGAACDIPAMLERALDYLATAKPGRAEIWLASDLQESNWLPNDGRWQTIRSTWRDLGQEPPVRILGLTGAPASAHALRLANVWRDGPDLNLDLEIRRTGNNTTALPLTLSMQGAAATQDSLELDKPLLSLRKRIPVGDQPDGGWGRLSLGPDLTPADNTVWFTFGGNQPLATTVVSSDRAGRLLALASAPPGSPGRSSVILAPENAHQMDWQNTRLIIWQAALPNGPVAQQLATFVEAGGSLLVFPPDGDAPLTGNFLGVTWSAAESAPADGKFPILSWETTGGPLAHFRDGQPMALDRLFTIKRRLPSGPAGVLATYEDGSPAALRLDAGRGQAVVLSTLPDPHWSDLESTNILLPLIERLLTASARFSNKAPTLSLGDSLPDPTGQSTPWEAVDTAAAGGAADAATTSSSDASPSAQPGVYRCGDTLAAFNVPASEFQPQTLERERLEKLFDGMRARLFEERVTREQGLASEIWRAFAIALLVFLLAEALLSLPAPRPDDAVAGITTPAP